MQVLRREERKLKISHVEILSSFMEKKWDMLKNDSDHVIGVVRYMLSLVMCLYGCKH
ncbi:unnamed protein product [Brassica oleracea var. botrytis]